MRDSLVRTNTTRVMIDRQSLILLVSRSMSIVSLSPAIVIGASKQSLGHQLSIGDESDDGNARWRRGYGALLLLLLS